jgi:hypothetical protein
MSAIHTTRRHKSPTTACITITLTADIVRYHRIAVKCAKSPDEGPVRYFELACGRSVGSMRTFRIVKHPGRTHVAALKCPRITESVHPMGRGYGDHSARQARCEDRN